MIWSAFPKETQPAQQEGSGAAAVSSAPRVLYFGIWDDFPELSSFPPQCPPYLRELVGSLCFTNFANNTAILDLALFTRIFLSLRAYVQHSG